VQNIKQVLTIQSKNASIVHYAVITEEKNVLSCSEQLYVPLSRNQRSER